MGEYDSGPRPLPWPLLYPLVDTRTVEDDGDFPPSSFVWPTDPNERTLVPFWLSLNEYNVLGSTIDVGSDIAFGEDALRVVWLWMRNWRIQVPICDAVDDCITNNPATIEAIVNQLMVNTTYNTYLTNLITTVAPGTGGNIYPPRPTTAEPDALCNAATYVVSKVRELINDIYDDLETLTAPEVLESLLGLFGWRSGPLYQLIGLLETADKTTLLADFDAAAADLICELVSSELDQAPVIAWTNSTYPPPSVLGDALRYGIGSALDGGQWALWIAAGALITAPDCGCVEPPTDCDDLTTGMLSWIPLDSVYAVYHDTEGFGRGTETTRLGIMKNYGGLIVSYTVTFNQAITGATVGIFPAYNSFGSETFFPGSGTSFTVEGSWPAGLAWEIIGSGALSSTLRVIEVCVVTA